MIKLKSLLHESYEVPGRRVGAEKLAVILEKLIPLLPEASQKEITKEFVNLLEGVARINYMRYSLFNTVEYEVALQEGVNAPAQKLRQCLDELLCKASAKIDKRMVETALKALEDLCITQ